MSHCIMKGDVVERLAGLGDESVQCVVTSPPYWGLRDYGVAGQIGLEATPQEYVERMVGVFREVWRVLRKDGTLWLNLGDCYATGAGRVGDHKDPRSAGALGPLPNRMPIAGLKPKDLVGMPWRIAFALQADGWWLRSDVVWSKPNTMPESVTDRPTKAHEYLFLLTRSERYYYDAQAIAEPLLSGPSDLRKMAEGLERIGGKHKDLDDPLNMASRATNIGRKRSVGGGYRSGNKARDIPSVDDGRGIPNDHLGRGVPWEDNGTGRNARSVWTIATAPFPEAHFATFPPELARRCIAAGTSERGRCPECGTPWVRELKVERARSVAGPKSQAKRDQGLATAFSGYEDGRTAPTVRTIGWCPGCSHDLAPVRCVVLDPFAGAGTTLWVAEGMGRDSLGIELNPAYVAIAEKRLATSRWQPDAPPLAVDPMQESFL